MILAMIMLGAAAQLNLEDPVTLFSLVCMRSCSRFRESAKPGRQKHHRETRRIILDSGFVLKPCWFICAYTLLILFGVCVLCSSFADATYPRYRYRKPHENREKLVICHFHRERFRFFATGNPKKVNCFSWNIKISLIKISTVPQIMSSCGLDGS
jgi:hypothetical protein